MLHTYDGNAKLERATTNPNPDIPNADVPHIISLLYYTVLIVDP
jgi:hypothetical protein